MVASPTLEDLPAVFTYAGARRLGVSDRRLGGWRQDGSVEQLARGVYRRSGEAGDPDLIEIAVRAPMGTLCLSTALARHGLTDEIPSSIDVALPRMRRPPRMAAPVTWHRFDDETFDVGWGEITVATDCTIGLYSPTRSIIDAFRLRHLEGHEQAIEALRRWLRLRGSQPSELLEMVRRFPRARKSIHATLQVLA